MNTLPRAFPSIVCCLAVLLAHDRAAAADNSVEKRYALPEHGFFVLKVPANWNDKLDQPPAAEPPTISFGARKGKAFVATVTPLWRARPDEPPPDRENVRQRADLALQSIAPFAVEKDIKLVEFKGASGPGFYFFATDSAPKPDEYKFMTRGVLAVGELSVMFTILTNEGQEGVIRDGLAMLRNAVHLQR